jgi:hypothetical protein
VMSTQQMQPQFLTAGLFSQSSAALSKTGWPCFNKLRLPHWRRVASVNGSQHQGNGGWPCAARNKIYWSHDSASLGDREACQTK